MRGGTCIYELVVEELEELLLELELLLKDELMLDKLLNDIELIDERVDTKDEDGLEMLLTEPKLLILTLGLDEELLGLEEELPKLLLEELLGLDIELALLKVLLKLE
jgi:hypothetical protein